MTIDTPQACHIPQLRQLWQEAFGDSAAFTELFFAHGFSPERCLAATEADTVLGALYWFDCEPELAYIYGVGVFKAFRGRGVGQALMEAVHGHLRKKGCILCPADEALFGYYQKLGYTPCAPVRTVTCCAGTPITLKTVDAGRYAQVRRTRLPAGAAVLGAEGIGFLASYAKLLEGNGFVASAVLDGDTVYGELLGDVSAAPGITAALGCKKGSFRTPGDQPFAMFLPLQEDIAPPTYLGLALD